MRRRGLDSAPATRHARMLTAEDGAVVLALSCRHALKAYRSAIRKDRSPGPLRAQARRALLRLGGDPERPLTSLRDYDHRRYGPFLGVSDEGSAARAIHGAALSSPKVRALSRRERNSPLVAGVAIDAERLGGIGEVVVGPDEYADIWLASVGRLLVTTNVGTRVNLRVYGREPRVSLKGSGLSRLTLARQEITKAFLPFVETPDGKPRPLTVFIEMWRIGETASKDRKYIRELAKYVESGAAAGRPRRPDGHRLGLAVHVRGGLKGKQDAFRAIDLAASIGLKVVLLDGSRRKAADRAISLPGLLDYFAPGIVGPILRRARERRIEVIPANRPDISTISRSIWTGLAIARSMGACLGKYGCFPLTLQETRPVIAQIQKWFPDWSAAPVFYIDQGTLRKDSVDVERDAMRGLFRWLDCAAECGARVVLIDTLDKAGGRRLLKASSQDKCGFLTPRQVARADGYAKSRRIRVLWAGGLGPRDALELGRLGVFGVYVTSAAATSVAASGEYIDDPALSRVKEPTRAAVLRTKILLEAGFLASRVDSNEAARLSSLANDVLSALEAHDGRRTHTRTAVLAAECRRGWKLYWSSYRP